MYVTAMCESEKHMLVLLGILDKRCMQLVSVMMTYFQTQAKVLFFSLLGHLGVRRRHIERGHMTPVDHVTGRWSYHASLPMTTCA